MDGSVKMTKLIAAKRSNIPSGEFGLPDERAYPMPDRIHAAKARAAQQLEDGNLTQGQHDAIVRKADRILYGP
jgi:hypothetical protein